MSTRYGIIFRLTDSGVTDPANTAHSRSGNGYDQPYPTTINGVTFGNQTDTSADNTSWSTGNDPRLYGIWRSTSTDGPQTIRIDLPDGPGNYRVYWLHAGRSYLSTDAAMHDGDGSGTIVSTIHKYNGGDGNGGKWMDGAYTEYEVQHCA